MFVGLREQSPYVECLSVCILYLFFKHRGSETQSFGLYLCLFFGPLRGAEIWVLWLGLDWAADAVSVFGGEGFVVFGAAVCVLADVGGWGDAEGDEVLDDLHVEEVEEEGAAHGGGGADFVGEAGGVDCGIAGEAAVVDDVVGYLVEFFAAGVS